MKNLTIRTVSELQSAVSAGELVKLHSSASAGYVSRKGEGEIRPYAGKFGVGYTHDTPRWDSTRYCTRTYYLAKSD